MKYGVCTNRDIDNTENKHDVVVIVIYTFFFFFFSNTTIFSGFYCAQLGSSRWHRFAFILYTCEGIEKGKKKKEKVLAILFFLFMSFNWLGTEELLNLIGLTRRANRIFMIWSKKVSFEPITKTHLSSVRKRRKRWSEKSVFISYKQPMTCNAID